MNVLGTPCKPSDQQSESSDFEPDELEANSDSFRESDMPGFVSEHTENLDLSLDHRCEDSDSEQDQSTEDSEQDFTQNISDSMDSLTCAADFSEYDESQAEAEYTDNDNDKEDESYEQNEMEVYDEESCRSSEDTPDDTYESDVGVEENCEHTSTADVSVDAGELHGDDSEDDPSQHSNFEESVESCTEEDLSSEDSKFCKTSLDDSFPSDPCSDSSEESDKAAQDDSGDEPMQWESFDENDAEKHPSLDERNEEDKKKTSTADAVIEDYFDLFDRADCSGQVFSQKQHYISCFDGGDIQHHLHLEEGAQKEKNQSDDWTLKSESSSTKDEAEDNESETFGIYPEYYQESEDDEVYYDDEAWLFDGHISDDYDEDPEFYHDSGREEKMFAPCAKEISVEGDVYEDKVSASENNDSVGEAATTADTEKTSDLKDDKIDKQDPELDGFPACSEMEPYWALIDKEQTGECFSSCAEDYYAYQIKSIQSSGTQPLSRFILDSSCTDQISAGMADGNISRNESEDAIASDREQEDAEVCPEEESSAGLGITVVKIIPNEQSSEPDTELQETSEPTSPLGIIHSVVSKHDTPQSRDSEEEQSDDESIEHCDCEYCIPPTQQV
ncbi:hypothetical protein GOODEAATRI_021848 [Goodea atripinnis]|uniref:Uncharacterized protein n=1 Tax=Goodea atripinnis TaxID=208336 RepID=A0ABV0NNT2_9TELE